MKAVYDDSKSSEISENNDDSGEERMKACSDDSESSESCAHNECIERK